MQLLDEQSAALKSKDLEALGRMWTADYIFVNPTGVVVTKDQRLKVLGSNDTRIDSLSRDEINIRLYENAAVVISRTTAKGRVAGKDIDAQFRATTVLVKKNGRWQIVSHQDNVITAH
jgi:ketosteroid isomerase-like protein